VDSQVECDYPATRTHIFLLFDGDQADGLYLTTMKRFRIPIIGLSWFLHSTGIIHRNSRATASHLPHGGERHCQKRTFRLVDRVYHQYLEANDNLFLSLFVDSDWTSFAPEFHLRVGAQAYMRQELPTRHDRRH